MHSFYSIDHLGQLEDGLGPSSPAFSSLASPAATRKSRTSPAPPSTRRQPSQGSHEAVPDRVMAWFREGKARLGSPEAIREKMKQERTRKLSQVSGPLKNSGKGLLSRRLVRGLTIDI